MKIQVILPIISDAFNKEVEKEVRQFISPDTVVEIRHLDTGTASIESMYDEALASRDIIAKTMEAEKNGFDAVFVDCFGDPGVDAAREMVSIPVVGGFQPAVLTACLLSGRFSIITVLPSVVPMIRNLCRKMGVEGNIASVRYINIAVLDLSRDDELKNSLLTQMEEAVVRDGAEAVVLGCTGMLGLAKNLQDEIAKKGYPIPVIDPTGAAIGYLELLVRNGLSQSKLTFPVPSDKARNC